MYSFFVSKKLIVCVTNFDHNLLLSWPFVGGGGNTLPMTRVYPTFPSLFIHFAGCCDLAKFWIWSFRTFKTNIIILNSQQKYSNFVYFGNYLRITDSIGTSAKCRSYTVMLLKANTLFSKTSHLFIRYAQLLHFMLFLLSKIVFYGVQKLKCKHVFRKIEIIHVWHIVSSVAQKRSSLDFSNSSCKLAMLSKVSYKNTESQALR